MPASQSATFVHRSFFVVVAFAGISTPTFGQTILRWKFTPGEKSHYEMKFAMSQEIKMDEQRLQRGSETSLLDMTWETKSVAEDGTATMTQTIDRIRWKQSRSNEPPIEYDSLHPEETTRGYEAMTKGCSIVIGEPIVVRVTPTGKILDVSLSEVFAASLKKESPKALGMLQFSEESLKGIFGQSRVILPEQPVVVGKTWEEKTAQVGQKSTTKYTFAGSNEHDGMKVEKIDLVAITKIQMPEDLKLDVNEQSTTGTVFWDNEVGRLVDADVQMKRRLKYGKDDTSVEQNIFVVTRIKRVAGVTPR